MPKTYVLLDLLLFYWARTIDFVIHIFHYVKWLWISPFSIDWTVFLLWDPTIWFILSSFSFYWFFFRFLSLKIPLLSCSYTRIHPVLSIPLVNINFVLFILFLKLIFQGIFLFLAQIFPSFFNKSRFILSAFKFSKFLGFKLKVSIKWLLRFSLHN